MFNRQVTRNKYRFMHLSIAALSALFIGCDSGDSSTQPSSPLTQDVVPSTLTGVWENKGYGRILSIEQSVTHDFQVNATSCWLSGDFLPHELDGFLVEVRLGADHQGFDTIAENVAEYTHPYTFSKLDALPAKCDEPNIVQATDDPITNYEMLWQTMDDYYAFFELRGVDWMQVDQTTRPLVSQVSEGAPLLEIFQEMLSPLKDGHVHLIAEDLGVSWSAGVTPDWLQRIIDYFEQENPQDELRTEFEQQNEYSDFDAFESAQFFSLFGALGEKQQENIASYFATAECDSNADICWGVSDSNVGYLSFERMFGFEEDGTEFDTAADLNVLRTVLDRAFTMLSGTDALIIDIRLNQGGQDRISLEIAGQFVAAEQVAYRKKARNKDGFANEHEVKLIPTVDTPYVKPIYLLTSGGTYSAAEIFALTMKGLPNVTFVGEPTGGIFSDAISKTLPNGWSFTLSSEIYSDPEGRIFEATGIPVDHAFDFFVIDDVMAGNDLAIEGIFELVSQNKMVRQ